MPDSKGNKQAGAGSRRFRRHFLCGALLCNCLYTEHEGLSTHVQREWSAEPSMPSILSLRIFCTAVLSRSKCSPHTVCVLCFLPIHSGHQVRWTYQPGSHRGGRSHKISHPPSFWGVGVMCGWFLAYCTCVVLNTVGESAMPDSKENKQADAGSRRFRRHFLCGALLCTRSNILSTEHEGLSTHTCPTGMVSRTFYAQHSVTKNLLYSSIIEMQMQSSYCVCVVFSSHSFWTSSSLDVPAGVTQEEGHTGFLIHLLSGVLV